MSVVTDNRTRHVFLSKIATRDRCWLWGRALNGKGYGTFWHLGKTTLAHRAAYQIFRGPIPEGMHIDHLCRVRHCVNPAHLELVSAQENCARGNRHVPLTHCARGHEMIATNLIIEWDKRRGRSKRKCRACWFARQKERQGRRHPAHDSASFRQDLGGVGAPDVSLTAHGPNAIREERASVGIVIQEPGKIIQARPRG